MGIASCGGGGGDSISISSPTETPLTATSSSLAVFITDAAIGKFELIDYAVALAPDGSIRQVEVLTYRESHGQDVRKRGWLQQFDGKSAANPLQADSDIATISGATLSCTHLTDGIRRIALLARLGLAPAK